MQETQAGVECAVLTSELGPPNETELSVSDSSASSSTDSSNADEYSTNTDPSTMTDEEYGKRRGNESSH